MTPEERRLVDVFMTAQAEPEGRMFSENILAGIKAVLNMRSTGPNNESVGPWKECVYKHPDAPLGPVETASSEGRQEPKHVCGLQGFNPMIDECPACSRSDSSVSTK